MNTATQRAPRIFSPSDLRSAGRLAPRDHVIRAATAVLMARAKAGDSEGFTSTVFEKRYPDDRVAPLILQRAAVNPATTATNAALVSQALGDFLSTVPKSAASRLFALGTRLDLAGVQSVSIPKITTNVTPTWLSEGSPLPVAQLALSDSDLAFKKMGVIVAFSREMAESTAVEGLVRMALDEAAGASLDASVFSTSAGSSTTPAGLLHDLVALTASSGTGGTAMIDDLSRLVGQVIANGGSEDVVFIAAPNQAAAIRLVAADFNYPVFSSRALSDGVVVAVDPAAFVAAVGSEPRISASENSVLHMEDTTPLAIGTAGSPPTVAAPVRSGWQGAIISLRLTVDVAFTTRVPASLVSGVNW